MILLKRPLVLLETISDIIEKVIQIELATCISRIFSSIQDIFLRVDIKKISIEINIIKSDIKIERAVILLNFV